MTLIKQEKLVFILVILYIQEYLCAFTKLFTGTRVSEDFQFRVPEIIENTQHLVKNHIKMWEWVKGHVRWSNFWMYSPYFSR